MTCQAITPTQITPIFTNFQDNKNGNFLPIITANQDKNLPCNLFEMREIKQ
jgi:hypothetical protein